MTVIQALSLQVRDGATRDAVLQAVDSAMAAWDNLLKAPVAQPARAKTKAQ